MPGSDVSRSRSSAPALALAALLVVPCVGSPHADDAVFSALFADATLRIDLYHHGHAREESVTVDRMLRETPWSGSTVLLDDPSPVGSYRLEMFDAASGSRVFATSFDSQFTEYRTTASGGDGVPRTYHEALRVPFPRRPVRIVVTARHVGTQPRPLLALEFDPARDRVADEPPPGRVEIIPVVAGDDPHATVDIVFLAEGYDDGDRFRNHLRRITDLLLSHEPYSSLRDLVTVTGVRPESRDRGCDEPAHGVWRDTPFDASFDAFGSPRYLLTENTRALRDVAAHVPYDTLVVMVDHDRYGGGGIYGQYCIFTADNPWSGYLLLHEFGHSFGGLGDEYYASGVAYTDLHPPGHEPPQPNLTALLDPSTLKWRDLVGDDVPLPTPWNKAAFDAAENAWQAERRGLQDAIAEARTRGAGAGEIDELQRQLERGAHRRAEASNQQLAAEPYAGRVGAFEGAGYASTGMYRPAVDCLMFTRGVKPLCPVCRRAVADRIRRVAGSPSEGHHAASIRPESETMDSTTPPGSGPMLQSGPSPPDAVVDEDVP